MKCLGIVFASLLVGELKTKKGGPRVREPVAQTSAGRAPASRRHREPKIKTIPNHRYPLRPSGVSAFLTQCVPGRSKPLNFRMT